MNIEYKDFHICTFSSTNSLIWRLCICKGDKAPLLQQEYRKSRWSEKQVLEFGVSYAEAIQ